MKIKGKFCVRYHRNGSWGEGFHTVSFQVGRGKDTRNLRAVVFDAPGRVAVTDHDDASARFDGPYFEPRLRAAIEAAAKDPRTFDRDGAGAFI